MCALQEWSFYFPHSCGSPAIKSCWPSKLDFLGTPPPIAGPPGWEAQLRAQNLHSVGELLWYNCFPVCGLPTQRVWDLILLRLYPSYHLTVASTLSLDVGYPFCRFQCFSIDGCSAVSCDSSALARRGECMSFYSAIFEIPN